MSAAIRPVFPADFADVVGLLRRLDPHRSPERWRPIFDFGWRRPDEPVGYAVYDGARVVGFMGMILSEMEVDGRLERFCNITSWVTDDEHRGAGALLVMTLKRFGDHTLTGLSSNAGAAAVLERLGFKELDSAWTILPPTTGLLARAARGCGRVLTEPDEIAPLLSAADARILRDHRSYAHHLLALSDAGYCYLVYSLRTRWRMRAAHFHFVSDRAVLGRCWPRIHRALFARHGVVFGEADSRLLAGTDIRGAIRKPMEGARLFKSATLRPEQVSDLYSELILLGLL